MKNRLLPLVACAAVLASIPFWNTDASAQTDTAAADARPKVPLGKSVIVTLDPRSNSRTELSKELQRYSGFAHHDTVEGILIHMDAEWIVVKAQAGVDENWIPRDKVLLLHANPQ